MVSKSGNKRKRAILKPKNPRRGHRRARQPCEASMAERAAVIRNKGWKPCYHGAGEGGRVTGTGWEEDSTSKKLKPLKEACIEN